MKKYFLFMTSVLAVLLFNGLLYGTAEAARVAVVPIQIDETKVQRASDFQSYYWDVMIEKFRYPDYELMDDDKVAAVVPEGGLKSYDEATLRDISIKTDAEVVVAMRLDEIKESPLKFRREPTLKCFMKGEFASYNRLTGKYYNKTIHYTGTIEEILTLRTDWQQQAFASELKRSINRTIDTKKK